MEESVKDNFLAAASLRLSQNKFWVLFNREKHLQLLSLLETQTLQFADICIYLVSTNIIIEKLKYLSRSKDEVLSQYLLRFIDFSFNLLHFTVAAQLCVNKTSSVQKSLKPRQTSVLFRLLSAAPSLISELRAEKIEQKSITLVWREPSYPNSSRTEYEVKYFEKVKSCFHHPATVVDPALPSVIWFHSPVSFLRIHLHIMHFSAWAGGLLRLTTAGHSKGVWFQFMALENGKNKENKISKIKEIMCTIYLQIYRCPFWFLCTEDLINWWMMTLLDIKRLFSRFCYHFWVCWYSIFF